MEATAAGALRLAAARGDLPTMELLTHHPTFQVDAHVSGFTPLMAAAVQGQEQAVLWLLHHGASVSASKQDGWGDTVLHYAAAKGNAAVAKMLLAFRADAAATNANGKSPAEVAGAGGHAELARYLEKVAVQQLPLPERVLLGAVAGGGGPDAPGGPVPPAGATASKQPAGAASSDKPGGPPLAADDDLMVVADASDIVVAADMMEELPPQKPPSQLPQPEAAPGAAAGGASGRAEASGAATTGSKGQLAGPVGSRPLPAPSKASGRVDTVVQFFESVSSTSKLAGQEAPPGQDAGLPPGRMEMSSRSLPFEPFLAAGTVAYSDLDQQGCDASADQGPQQQQHLLEDSRLLPAPPPSVASSAAIPTVTGDRGGVLQPEAQQPGALQAPPPAALLQEGSKGSRRPHGSSTNSAGPAIALVADGSCGQPDTPKDRQQVSVSVDCMHATACMRAHG
jgi:hypothetical protein